jgi:hypothetical protein
MWTFAKILFFFVALHLFGYAAIICSGLNPILPLSFLTLAIGSLVLMFRLVYRIEA